MKGTRILIVDDEKNTRTLFSECLQKEGYLIEEVADGKKALGKIQEFNPKIVLLDIIMPGMLKNELVKKIKELRPQIAIIMVTGLGKGPIYIECSFKGAFQVLTKPVKLEKLKTTIKHALESRQVKRA